jgi:uncharacterized protein
MAVAIPKQAIDLIAAPDSTKVLATVDEHGVPHLAVKQSLQVTDDGKLLYLELLESSRTNRNMVGSIWFDREVAVIVRGADGRCYQIKGKPARCHIAGPVFRKHYEAVREVLGDVDLAAVWVVEPSEIADQCLPTRRMEEENKHPFFNHLDRLARKP